MANNYKVYFDIDEQYFPIINESSIRHMEATDPDMWTRTFPHKSFVKMLREFEKILDRQNKRSLWIEGVYGSGKSRCAYALSHILGDSAEKVEEYWGKYDALRKEKLLLQKYLGHKQNKRIMVVRRYSSSEIHGDRNLIMAIQHSVRQGLHDGGYEYLGAATLRESAISWLSDEDNAAYFDSILKKHSAAIFGSTETVASLLSTLKKTEDAALLGATMDGIFRIAEEKNILALNISVDDLCDWLRDVVQQNDIQLVFLWDEFTEFFVNNKSLTAFQKIVELCNEIPFYFIIVTHYQPLELQEKKGTSTSKKLRDRFALCPIELPESVAFDLIGAALRVRPEAAEDWKKISGLLNERLNASRRAVMKAANIENEESLRQIFPIHPYAAFVLKNIATAYRSNQRSMFDFIKTPYETDEDLHAFRWYAAQNGPHSDFPFLTVDLLWDYFYEHGSQYLSTGIREILARYDSRKHMLNADEQAVLKTILILQALNFETGTRTELFFATEENIGAAFEGTENLDATSSVNIALNLVKKGILLKRPIDKKRNVFEAEKESEEIVQLPPEACTTKLLAAYNASKPFESLLELSPALRLRFESKAYEANSGKVQILTKDDFASVLTKTRGAEPSWKTQTYLVIARNPEEAEWLRSRLAEEVVKSENADVLFIDATAENLSDDQYDNFRNYGGHALHYQGNDKEAAQKYTGMCQDVLLNWRNAIQNGSFILYHNGETIQTSGIQGVAVALQQIVRKRFPQSFEFVPNLSENILKLTQAIASAKCGMIQKTGGVVVGIEKRLFPEPGIWQTANYWTSAPSAPVSVVKAALDEFVHKAQKKEGQVSIRGVWNYLETEFGFARCNLYAFLAGFLLKEYANDQSLRYADENGGQEEMIPDRLAEALGNAISEKTQKDSFIVSQTREERELYKVAKEAWDARRPSSPAAVGTSVNVFIRKRGFPITVLETVTDPETYEFARGFVEMHKAQGSAQQEKALELGKRAMKKPGLVDSLKSALTEEKFLEGAKNWAAAYHDGALVRLSEEIGAGLLADIKASFDVAYQSLWGEDTQQAELAKLEVEYRFVKFSNKLFNAYNASLRETHNEWCKQLDFFRVSYEAISETAPLFVDVLRRITMGTQVLPELLSAAADQFEANYAAIEDIIRNQTSLFRKEYAPWLEGLSDDEIDVCVSKLPVGMFQRTRSQNNDSVKKCAEEVKRDGRRTELIRLWKSKTGTKNAQEWSQVHNVPILCVVDPDEFLDAKAAFETLASPAASNHDVELSLEYFARTKLFEKLGDEETVRAAFDARFLAEKSVRKFVDRDAAIDALKEVAFNVYDWYYLPSVGPTLQALAEKEYDAGGEAKVLDKIDAMDPETLKRYLKDLVRGNKRVGMEILLDDAE